MQEYQSVVDTPGDEEAAGHNRHNMNPRPALLHRSRTALLVLVLVLYLFSHPGRMMAQQTGSALKASASGILDNALFITDYNPNGGASSPCVGPGRFFRIPSMSGWEA